MTKKTGFSFFNFKYKIGVMGSASGPTLKNKRFLKKAYEVGRHIALNNCILINGACPGLPDEAAKGARAEGGFVVGISPAYSKKEHIYDYKSPITHDFIIYTGFGLMERDILNIRASDGIIILGGGIGSLNEFTVAYDEGRPMGILERSGGISSHIPKILEMADRKMMPNIIIESNPQKLVEKMISYIKKYPAPDTEDSRIVKEIYGRRRKKKKKYK